MLEIQNGHLQTGQNANLFNESVSGKS